MTSDSDTCLVTKIDSCWFKKSEIPNRGRSKCGRTQKEANACRRAQMSATLKERKRKSARERKRAPPCKSCKQPGLTQPVLVGGGQTCNN